MFGLFKSPAYSDPQLGDLRRAGGLWRGSSSLGEAQIPLALAGTRSAPDSDAIEIARSIPSGYPHWQPFIEQAMFEHYAPYAEAMAGEESAESGIPHIEKPADVWPHIVAEFVQVTPLDGVLAIEIGYRVAWDDEHTLGARLRDRQLIELNGSVLPP